MASYSPTPSPHPPHSSRRQPQSNLGSSVASSLSANSNAAKTASTEEAIVVQLFSKAAQVVVQGRIDASSSNPNSSSKTNKWVRAQLVFNLETVEVDPLRSELKFWKSLISTQPTQLLPMILDVYLDVSHVHNSDQHLVLKDETSLRRQRISTDSLVGSSLDPITGASVAIKKNRILLESWQLTLLQPAPSFPPETAVMYKKCVMFFRSLYTHVRLLPAYRLFRRIKKPSDSGTANLLKIGYRLSSSRVMPMDEAGLDQLHTKDSRNGIAEYNFGALETTMGIINMHVMYRTECDFTLSDPEPLFGAPADLETNYFYSQSHESRQNSFLRQQHADDPLYQPPSLSNSNRRISAPSRPFGTSVSNRANVSVLGSSPRSFGGTGNRASLPNTSHPGALPLPVQRVGPPSVSGASATGGISPAFTLSGSFPRSYGAQKSGLTDAIAMGLFDGVQQGLPFSVGRNSTGGPDEQKENDRKSFEDVFAGLEESPPFDVFLNRDTSK
ncbi:autophagy protein 13, partial [Rhizoclosmatium hyalinum]